MKLKQFLALFLAIIFFLLFFAIIFAFYSDKASAEAAYHKAMAKKPFIVVLDPGHGGVDSGAHGRLGSLEKNITLRFAKLLAGILEQDPLITARLTRDSDIFVKLQDRVEWARQRKAQLFISIHADSIDTPQLRGTTIYTLSDKASDELARKLADSENNREEGPAAKQAPPMIVRDILLDLLRRETYVLSLRFADQLLANLSAYNMLLIKNPHRYAGFQVLRAPDIPSILLELGYLSNIEDEKAINNPQWMGKMAHIIAKTIQDFAKNY